MSLFISLLETWVVATAAFMISLLLPPLLQMGAVRYLFSFSLSLSFSLLIHLVFYGSALGAAVAQGAVAGQGRALGTGQLPAVTSLGRGLMGLWEKG